MYKNVYVFLQPWLRTKFINQIFIPMLDDYLMLTFVLMTGHKCTFRPHAVTLFVGKTIKPKGVID